MWTKYKLRRIYVRILGERERELQLYVTFKYLEKAFVRVNRDAL